MQVRRTPGAPHPTSGKRETWAHEPGGRAVGDGEELQEAGTAASKSQRSGSPGRKGEVKDPVHEPLERPARGGRGQSGRSRRYKQGRGWGWVGGEAGRIRESHSGSGLRVQEPGQKEGGVSRGLRGGRHSEGPGVVFCVLNAAKAPGSSLVLPIPGCRLPRKCLTGRCSACSPWGPPPYLGLHPRLKASGCRSLWPPCSTWTYRTTRVSVPTHSRSGKTLLSRGPSALVHPETLLRLVLCPSRVDRITASPPRLRHQIRIPGTCVTSHGKMGVCGCDKVEDAEMPT